MNGAAANAATAALDSSPLDSSIEDWHRVTPALKEKLQRLQLSTLRDVLFHLPLRYMDKTRISPIANLSPGTEALVEGAICDANTLYYGKKQVLTATLADATGQLQLRFFHVYRGQQQRFREGTRMRCYGQVRAWLGGLEIIHPECSSATGTSLEERLTPVYPSTDKLQQRVLRQLTEKALSLVSSQGYLRTIPMHGKDNTAQQWPSVDEALRFIHQPPPGTDLEQLQSGLLPEVQRLAFEELLAYRLALLQRRNLAREYEAAAIKGDAGQRQLFIGKLPFILTKAQQKVSKEIVADLARNVPMQRLLQGDVGSGKTVVAAIAALDTITSGYSACIMAPTELLAQQHYQTIKNLFLASGHDCELMLLTGRLTAAQRRNCKQRIATGEPCFVIGTHALIQDDIKINKLALVVIDEQHRFGVHQRLELLQRASAMGQLRPHQLIMTATPIPRTLAMTIYTDLDISVLDTMPQGRQQTRTSVISSQRRDDVVAKVGTQCQRKRQVYWVCSLIDESDQLQKQAAISTYETLTKRLPQLHVGLVHGRLNAKQKDQVMQSFIDGDIELLVATTVIEVGIDVANANLMVIENAERLGLAQLHQLRGRVGRNQERGDCVLLYDPPLSEVARQRLEIMKQSSDGFVIAEKDMMLRGAGEVFGLRQKGLPETRIADFARDKGMLPEVTATADRLLATDQDLAVEVIARWQAGRLHYSDA